MGKLPIPSSPLLALLDDVESCKLIKQGAEAVSLPSKA